jgi:hypothetical protein
VILFKVNPPSIALFELEGDAPRAIDVNRVTFRPVTPEGMEVEAREVHVVGFRGCVQGVQPQLDPAMKQGIYLCRPVVFPQFGEALADERSDHQSECKATAYMCQVIPYTQFEGSR